MSFCLGLLLVSALPAADLVLVNGKVWTVNRKQPEAEAVAVWHGRILVVGTSAEAANWSARRRASSTSRAAASCRASTTATSTCSASGMRLSQVALKDAEDEAEFGKRLQRVRPASCRAAAGCSAATGTTTAPSTASCRPPRCSTSTSPDRPVFLRRYDGHMAVVNTRGPEAGRHHRRDARPGRRRHLPQARQQGADRPAARQRDGPGRAARPAAVRRRRSSRRSGPPWPRPAQSASPACRTWTAATPPRAASCSASTSSWPAAAS